jgi:hypothetical protein
MGIIEHIGWRYLGVDFWKGETAAIVEQEFSLSIKSFNQMLLSTLFHLFRTQILWSEAALSVAWQPVTPLSGQSRTFSWWNRACLLESRDFSPRHGQERQLVAFKIWMKRLIIETLSY